MKQKMSLADYDKAIFKKLDYILALVKLMVKEKRLYNSLYLTKEEIKHLKEIQQTS